VIQAILVNQANQAIQAIQAIRSYIASQERNFVLVLDGRRPHKK
jgi:stage V sporulation protein SpoVS